MTVKLNNGVEMPRLGLGTWRMSGKEAHEAALWAFEIGYRMIDTLPMYLNETEVGRAVKDSGLAREDIFVVTKLEMEDQGRASTLRACEASLRRLGMDYIDLYLIHWPVENLTRPTWEAMQKLVLDKKCRAIGVSNFSARQIRTILENFEIPPAVNQIEFNPFVYPVDLLEFCKNEDIQVQAYTPLAKGAYLGDSVLVDLAKKHGKTTAQIMLRWEIQKGAVPVPKSARRDRIAENFSVWDFTLSDGDMQALDSLSKELKRERSMW